jgi:hypothetical protein
MGRIRKVLAWTLSPGGSMHGLVRPELSAEQAAREQADFLREQNRLLEEIAGARSSTSSTAGKRSSVPVKEDHTCCLDCINLGCGLSIGGKVNWTSSASRCDCRKHH